MKFVSSQIALFLEERGVRRNIGSFSRFLLLLLIMVGVYSLIFHVIMRWEGRTYTLLTGVYWTFTVMSTLGFGDITFQSDPGKMFSVVVLVSGMLCLLVMMPFAFIQLIYLPWLEAHKKSQTPRDVPESVRGHIILVGLSPISLNVVDDLTRHGFYCVLLSPDIPTTLDLIDQGYHAVIGGHDDSTVYRRLGVERAAMLVTLDNDIRNTNVAFSARGISPSLPIVARAEKEDAIDILQLAGCSQVFQFRNLLGRALAHRVISGKTRASVLTRFGSLLISEAPVARTSLVGKTIRESDLRRDTGLNVVGIWEKGNFSLPAPDTPLTEKTVLVLAGTEAQMTRFEHKMGTNAAEIPASAPGPDAALGPVLILGGGRVGKAAARELHARGMAVAVVDTKPCPKALDGIKWVHGDASDLAILEEAGITTAPSVIITTHDDDTNIYLTIYCRRLRPDVQIISRASLDRNFSVLHTAGADLVLSLATMIANSLINCLSPGKVFLLNEGLNIFRSVTRDSLEGKSLISSGIRAKTHCSVVALCDASGAMSINPSPDYVFRAGDVLYLVGDSQSEAAYYEHYGHETGEAAPSLVASPALRPFTEAAANEFKPEDSQLHVRENS